MQKPPEPEIRVERVARRHQSAFLAAAERSRKLHGRWAQPPLTAGSFREYVRVMRRPTHAGHLVVDVASGEPAGVINVNEIVRGGFQSAYLGYYAFAPYAGRGYMARGLASVLELAFGDYDLHRLEANVQPGNTPSLRLVRQLGFRREGFSPRYLHIAGRWRDHERWAITAEDWRSARRRRPRPV